MDKVRLVLTVITIAITVVPIVGMLLTYQNNLLGMFVPPEIKDVADKFSGGGGGSEGPELQPVGPPQYDPALRTIRQSIQFKNTLPLDITLKSITGDVECVEHSFHLGTASLKEPVSIPVGETRTLTLLITWTDQAITHFGTAQPQGHASEETVEVVLANVSVDISGIQLQLDQNQMEQRMEIPNPAL
jgi:hypothetical protein